MDEGVVTTFEAVMEKRRGGLPPPSSQGLPLEHTTKTSAGCAIRRT